MVQSDQPRKRRLQLRQPASQIFTPALTLAARRSTFTIDLTATPWPELGNRTVLRDLDADFNEIHGVAVAL